MKRISVLGRRACTTRTNSAKSAATSAGSRPAWMSLPPARRKICLGSWGKMRRSAKWVESTISVPPKPRLMTFFPGKSSASVFHSRTVEEPMKRMPPFGGGFFRSAAS